MGLEPGDHVWFLDGEGNDLVIDGERTSFERNHIVDDADPGIRRGLPRTRHGTGSFAWLDNNPGNITATSGGFDLEQIPGKADGRGFLVFPDRAPDSTRSLRTASAPDVSRRTATMGEFWCGD